MATYLPLFVIVPLLSAAVTIFFPKATLLNRTLLLSVPIFSIGFSVALLCKLSSTPVLATQIGGWAPGIAIPFAADTLSALMLITTSVLLLACNCFAIASKDSDERYFAPLVLVISAGVAGALLTADLFNLFVFIELMFLPSCGLIIMRKGIHKLEAPRLYVSMNLMVSGILVTGIGLVYASAGTVNLAQLAGTATKSSMVAAAGAVVLIAFSIKAALVPFHGWLARTYPASSPVVSALFSGLHTKIAIYAIFRVYSLMFEGAQQYLPFFTIVCVASMVIGALGALGETSLRSILSFGMISQIGYILLGLALFGPLGLTAGIFYLIHHMIVKASLFLSAAAIEETYGTTKLSKLTGLAHKEKFVAVAFFAAALSIAGVPPFSGFIAKLLMIQAAISENNLLAVVAVIGVSIVTLMYSLKIWSGAFWSGDANEPQPSEDDMAMLTKTKIKTTLVIPGAVLATLSLLIGLNPNMLIELSTDAANSLVNVQPYIEAVLTQ